MKRIHLLLLLMGLMLSSCFEIIEEVELNADGSGSYTYTVNMSQSRTKLNQIMKLDSIHGYRVPKKSELNQPLTELIQKASQVPGILNPKTEKDLDNYILSFTCEFDHIDALNQLVVALRESNKGIKSQIPEEHFSYDKPSRRYQRNGDYSIQADLVKMKKADRVIFDGAIFTSIFRSNRPLAQYTNEQAKLSPSGKALMLRMQVLDLIHEKVSMGNTIYITQ